VLGTCAVSKRHSYKSSGGTNFEFLLILPRMKKGLSLLLILLISPNIWGQDFGPVKEGVLNLTAWNSQEYPVISLDGEWAFYWNKLLLSKDLKNNPATTFAQLSIPWNEQPIEGNYLPKDGCATYVLNILLPSITDSVAFAVPAVFNSYAFWVNGELICSSGKVGTNAAETIPGWRPRTVSIANSSDTLEVIFQIANFQQTRGGCAELMRIGDTHYLEGLDSVYHKSGTVLIILFLITGVAGLIFYFIERSSGFLFLGLLSLAYTIRFLFSDLYFYYDFGIDISWEWAAKIEYATIPLIILCASYFIATIYPQEFKRAILYVFVILNALLIVITVLSPSSLFSPLLVVLQITGLLLVLYTMYAIIRALIFQRKGAWVSALGTGVFTLVGFYNIYAFITLTDLNRTVIHSGYAIALILNVISLLYRTPMRLRSEEQDMLHFSDFYNDNKSVRT
jgi:hypothetical protein